MDESAKAILVTVGRLSFSGLYAILIIYLCLTLDLGALSWAVAAVLISPIAFLAFRKEKERMRFELASMQAAEWNVQELVQEYKGLLNKKRKTT